MRRLREVPVFSLLRGRRCQECHLAEARTTEKLKKWCCQTGLNCRPLHYQWSALPLSYGSVPRMRESARRAPQGGRSLPQGPLGCKRAKPLRAVKTFPPGALAASFGRSEDGSIRFPLCAPAALIGRTSVQMESIRRIHRDSVYPGGEPGQGLKDCQELPGLMNAER